MTKEKRTFPPSGKIGYFTTYDMVSQLYADTNSPIGVLVEKVPDHHLIEKKKELEEIFQAVITQLETVYRNKTQTSKEVGDLMSLLITCNVAVMGAAVIFGAPYDLMKQAWFQTTVAHIQGNKNVPIPTPEQIIEASRTEILRRRAEAEEAAKNQPGKVIVPAAND